MAGVELLLDLSDFSDFSEELDDLLSPELELVPESLPDPLVELVDFLPDSRLSVR